MESELRGLFELRDDILLNGYMAGLNRFARGAIEESMLTISKGMDTIHR